MHPMQPFLMGWLMGQVDSNGREAMKVVKVAPCPEGRANEFDVYLTSGTVLRVMVILASDGEKEGERVRDARLY